MFETEILFRRAGKILVDEFDETAEIHFREVASLDANLRKLGYALSDKAVDRLLHISANVLGQTHVTLTEAGKELKGVRNYKPMYPNFPTQVMEASDAELYINAIMHYFGDVIGFRITPEYAKLARPELEFDNFTILEVGDYSDFYKLMRDLVGSNSAYSEADRKDIASLSKSDFVKIVSVADFKNRENKVYIGAVIVKNDWLVDARLPIFDTATDVLRLAVALSGGDISLAENTKFRNFKRSERRLLLGALNNVKSPVEDMLRNAQTWKRLGEKLHPGEYSQFTNAQAAFAAVRENVTFESFNAKVEKALANRNYILAVELLKTRPGEFARRLDHLLRNSLNPSELVNTFGKVAKDVSPTVLVQLRNQFDNRDGKRVFFPKGSIAKMQIIEDTRAVIDEGIRLQVSIICDTALGEIFKGRDSLGKVWIDPELKKIAIPFGGRSNSAAVKTLGRSSRLPLDADTKTLRFFIWWKDIDSGYDNRVDIDLSAVALDENFNSVFDLTYYNLRDGGAVHSGDITSAPDGASEFIDIDIAQARANGARYVAMTLHSFTGQMFNDIPEVFAGFMERSKPNSGEIYEPATVKNKVDVTARSRAATPFIFDLETGEAIWVDLTITIKGRGHHVASTKTTITDMVDAMVNLTPPNLYDLFISHATVRGELVDKEEADTVYSLDGDVTPFDTEDILANYL